MIHTPHTTCEGCDNILRKVHPQMCVWFYWIKDIHPEVHVAKGWRDKQEQDEDFELGKSKLKYPDSKHNCIDEYGLPSSEALDIFQIIDGKGVFEKEFYEKVFEETRHIAFPIKWGGEFKTFPDLDHYELIKEIL